MVVETAVLVVVMVTVVVVAVIAMVVAAMPLKFPLNCPAGCDEQSAALGSYFLGKEQSSLSWGKRDKEKMGSSFFVIVISGSEGQLEWDAPESLREGTCSVVYGTSNLTSSGHP